MPKESITRRVLAIDPFSRGVGFAVFEGPDGLVDWGLKTTGRADSSKAVSAIEALIDRFRPDVLALENWESAGARRCDRIDLLLNHIASTERNRVRVRLISPREIRAIGPLPAVGTKYGRACFLTERFPELLAFLPPVRKPWMSEDERMSIFDAVAFAVACFPRRSEVPEPPSADLEDVSP
jgi:hypothetical protein